jgi:hypothetical protein
MRVYLRRRGVCPAGRTTAGSSVSGSSRDHRPCCSASARVRTIATTELRAQLLLSAKPCSVQLSGLQCSLSLSLAAATGPPQCDS